eukprot:TRINITY_DN322_c0_g1_i4.p1 TRINITY_DN322_c0_g1~~TRINITY_DN322_c0_g1_i4.p1  ORF type:complete len:195 (-),score=33.78 TRINITY_DN322_c0_g1_i4:183-767(-)
MIPRMRHPTPPRPCRHSQQPPPSSHMLLWSLCRGVWHAPQEESQLTWAPLLLHTDQLCFYDEHRRIMDIPNLAEVSRAQVEWTLRNTPIPPGLMHGVHSLNSALDFMEMAVFKAATLLPANHDQAHLLPIAPERIKKLAWGLKRHNRGGGGGGGGRRGPRKPRGPIPPRVEKKNLKKNKKKFLRLKLCSLKKKI